MEGVWLLVLDELNVEIVELGILLFFMFKVFMYCGGFGMEKFKY